MGYILALLAAFVAGAIWGRRVWDWAGDRFHRALWGGAIALALASPATAQTMDTSLVRVPYDSIGPVPADSVGPTTHDTTYVVLRDSLFRVCCHDSLVIVARPTSGPPAGYTPIVDQPMSGLPVASWVAPYPASLRWLTEPGVTFARITYPAGFASGRAPLTTETLNFRGRGITRLWVRLVFRLSPNFYGEPSRTNKLIHLWRTPQHNVAFLSAEGAGTAPLTLFIRGQKTANDAQWAYLRPNQGRSAVLARGVWHTVDLILGTDGTAEAWLNGVQTHRYSGVGWQATGWEMVSLSPTWGGNTTARVPATQYLDVDQLTAAGQ